jgi:hypothetical protein
VNCCAEFRALTTYPPFFSHRNNGEEREGWGLQLFPVMADSEANRMFRIELGPLSFSLRLATIHKRGTHAHAHASLGTYYRSTVERLIFMTYSNYSTSRKNALNFHNPDILYPKIIHFKTQPTVASKRTTQETSFTPNSISNSHVRKISCVYLTLLLFSSLQWEDGGRAELNN